MGLPKGRTNGPKFGEPGAADPRKAQLLGAATKRSHRERVEWFERFTDLALELTQLSDNEFQERFAHPASKAEEILLWQFSDPKTAYTTLKDFQEQVIGKPRQQKDINVTAPAGLTINVATKQEAEDLDNLL